VADVDITSQAISAIFPFFLFLQTVNKHARFPPRQNSYVVSCARIPCHPWFIHVSMRWMTTSLHRSSYQLFIVTTER